MWRLNRPGQPSPPTELQCSEGPRWACQHGKRSLVIDKLPAETQIKLHRLSRMSKEIHFAISHAQPQIEPGKQLASSKLLLLMDICIVT